MSKLICQCGEETRDVIEEYYTKIDGVIYEVEDVPQNMCDTCQVTFTHNTYVNLIENAINSVKTAVKVSE